METINICRDEIEDISMTFPAISQELISEINNAPEGGFFDYPHLNECNCPYSEIIEVKIVETYPPQYVELNICEEDLPLDFLGITIETGNEFLLEQVVLPGLLTVPNEDGLSCDSTIILTTIVYPVISIAPIHVEICQGEEYEGYAEEGTYETIFENVYGCDSTVTLVLTVLPEDDPSCEPVSTIDLEKNQVSVYPIPSSNTIHVESELLGAFNSRYLLLNTSGKCVAHGNINKANNAVHVKDLPNGIYILKLLIKDIERSVKVAVLR